MLRLILKKETQALIYKQVVINVELLNLLWIEVFTFVFPSVNGQRQYTKIFLHFWLTKSTRIIHHKEILLTKFGKNFAYKLNRWHQKYSASKLQIIEPLTQKTWGRGWVVLIVRTKWLKSRRNILLFSRRNIV